jgi:mRNA interferase RelE/StbE
VSYQLGFLEEALKEWRKLDPHVREMFKDRLAERLERPRVTSAKLSGNANRYKIKINSLGYRLVYEVRDREVLVVVIAVGKRERGVVYSKAAKRS